MRNQQRESVAIAGQVERDGAYHRHLPDHTQHLRFAEENKPVKGRVIRLLAGVGAAHRGGKIDRRRQGVYLVVTLVDGLDQPYRVGVHHRAG